MTVYCQTGYDEQAEYNAVEFWPNPEEERGATLLEATLVLALFGAFIGIANSILANETEKQRLIALGRDIGFMTNAAQQYVTAEYKTIRDQFLFDSDEAMHTISMSDIVTAGYLPRAVLSNGRHRNSYGQQYHLLVRAVNRNDTAYPQTTLTISDIDTDEDNEIDSHLVDGIGANNELDLEAILVSKGGDSLGPLKGHPAMLSAKMFSVGFLEKSTIAKGPYGVWELDISAYRSLDEYPEHGHFVSLIAASGFGNLHQTNISDPASETLTVFDRCPNATGELLTSCLAGNDIFTEVVFNNLDSDSDGTPDNFGTISGAYHINFGKPVDSDSDGNSDIFAEIACSDHNSSTIVNSSLTINCAKVTFIEDVNIGSNLTISGDTNVSGTVEATRFLAGAIDGQDLAKGIYFADIVAMHPVTHITMPVCNDINSEPKIYAVPAAYSNPNGYPIVGVRAKASVDGNSWIVRMQVAIDRDSDDNDMADTVELNTVNDHALVLTRCS